MEQRTEYGSLAGMIAIITIGLGFLAIFSEKLDLLLAQPLQSSADWCLSQPCFEIGATILTQPSSTVLVYGLALITCFTGIRFISISQNQRSRFWWGISLVLTGIGAGLAGTSYQAFGYELKCRGNEFCLWTDWWELAYMLCTVAGGAAAFMAMADSTLSERAQRFWKYYALISTLIYTIILVLGMILVNRFLLSFEFMLLFVFFGGFFIGCQELWEYFKTRKPLIIKILGVWVILILVIGIYYLALLSNITSRLWERGIWFTENDVLHIFMVIWVILSYRILVNSLGDTPR